VCDLLDDAAGILITVKKLKPDLVNIIEPDARLLDELRRLKVLTRRHCDEVRAVSSVDGQNDALLDLFVSKNKCRKFVQALQRTGQQPVVDVITRNGGEQCCCVVICQSYGDEQTVE